MFGLGMSEIILLGIIALIVIGPKELPQMARTIGRFMNELKRSTNILSDEIKEQVRFDEQEIEQQIRQRRQELRAEENGQDHNSESAGTEISVDSVEDINQINHDPDLIAPRNSNPTPEPEQLELGDSNNTDSDKKS